jgi:hypothetical protein
MKSEKKLSGMRIIIRSAFPGLLAINIAIYISLYGEFNPLFHFEGANPNMVPVVIEYASLILGIPIACLVLLPVWMLQSSGLMCSKKVESYKRPVTPDIESVGQFYIKMLKGYVGISTIISYSFILFQYLTTGDQSILLIVFIDPIIIILAFVPISLILEMRSNKINTQLNNYYEKMKIDTRPKKIIIR